MKEEREATKRLIDAEREATRQLFLEQMKGIDAVNQAQQVQLDTLNSIIATIKDDLVRIHEQLRAEEDQIAENELSRLRSEILGFAQRLRNGEEMNLHQYEYIFDVYEKYTAMGGNHYASSEFAFIKRKKVEYDENVNK